MLPGGLNGNAELVPVGGNGDDWFLLNLAGAGARDTSDRRLLEVALDTRGDPVVGPGRVPGRSGPSLVEDRSRELPEDGTALPRRS